MSEELYFRLEGVDYTLGDQSPDTIYICIDPEHFQFLLDWTKKGQEHLNLRDEDFMDDVLNQAANESYPAAFNGFRSYVAVTEAEYDAASEPQFVLGEEEE